MANNIMAIYGEVPELVEKKNEIVESYLNEKTILTMLNIIFMIQVLIRLWKKH